MISGHKTRSVFDRYNIVSQDDLKDAALKRQKFTEKQDEQLQFSYNPPKKEKRVVALSVATLFSYWCPGPESNRHTHKEREILSLLRLPVPPPGQRLTNL